MPVKVAYPVDANSSFFFMDEERARTQDIRPLKVLILNLMPNKSETEQQLLRLLGNTALQVEVSFLTTATYQSKNTPKSYLKTFYQTFDQIKYLRYDALMITGSPVEHMAFEDVAYWAELVEILDWANENVFSSYFICWAAQAALYHYYGIGKRPLGKKLSGVYRHRVVEPSHTLIRGFDDFFWAPHSRHTTIDEEATGKEKDLIVLAESEEAGTYLLVGSGGRRVFVTGHGEYDALTLDGEYKRDTQAGLSVEMPKNYYEGGSVTVRWRAHANLLVSNWLNYHVYQTTPYDLAQLSRQDLQS
jgi:homoserine O-succinyltransferase